MYLQCLVTHSDLHSTICAKVSLQSFIILTVKRSRVASVKVGIEAVNTHDSSSFDICEKANISVINTE